MKNIFKIIWILFPAMSFAQTDTLYLNADFDECAKPIATYFRLISKQGNKFLVKDMFMKTGKPQMVAECSELWPLVKDGKCTYYLESGRKEAEGTYVNDKKIGRYVRWDEDGKDSTISDYNKDGLYKTTYRSKSTAGQTDDRPLTITEEMPSYPGGNDAMFAFIRAHIKYPVEERNAGRSGTCYITFVVERDGKLSDVHVLKGIAGAPALDAEALRVVSSMPDWKPGMQNGINVRVQFNLPVKFTL